MQRMEARAASRVDVRQALVRAPAKRCAGAGSVRRRDVGRHDQVLPAACFTRDRRVRRAGDVGRHRLPPRRMLGWMAESVNDESLRFVHLRPQGASQKSIWAGRLRAGFGQYYMGTAPLYYLASAGYRAFEHPALIGSVAMLWGYTRSAVRRLPRYERRGIPPISPPLPVRVPAARQGGGDGTAERPAGGPLAPIARRCLGAADERRPIGVARARRSSGNAWRRSWLAAWHG